MNHVFILAVNHGYSGTTELQGFSSLDLAKVAAMKIPKDVFYDRDDTVTINKVPIDDTEKAVPNYWWCTTNKELSCKGDWTEHAL